MGASLTEIKLGQGPVLAAASKPKTGEVITNILHGVGLIGHQAFEVLNLRTKLGDLVGQIGRSGRCYDNGRRGILCKDGNNASAPNEGKC
jgi:hypothetical protein